MRSSIRKQASKGTRDAKWSLTITADQQMRQAVLNAQLLTNPDSFNKARVSVSGTARDETVVLLHSSASSGSQWRSLREWLESDFRVLTPDLYGYGEAPAWSGHRPMRLADEAARVIGEIAPADYPAHLVGHSYGGAVALRLALENPSRVRSLTLIEPVAFYLLRHRNGRDKQLLGQVHAVAQAVQDAVACGNYWGGMERFVDYWNGRGAWKRMKAERSGALAARTYKIPLDFWSTTTEETLLDHYRQLDIPTLILRGEKTPAPTRRITELLAQALPSTRYRVIPGAGHMSPLTHGESVNAAISKHLVQSNGKLTV